MCVFVVIVGNDGNRKKIKIIKALRHLKTIE